MILAVVVVAAMGVAFANGANDNFKGVATLFGSGTTSYHHALIWATFSTFLGSLTAFLLAERLIKEFTGANLVSETVAVQPAYVATVAIATALTVLLATCLGLPISTTHAIVGGLVGAGLVSEASVSGNTVAAKFLLPLLVSPILAFLLTVVTHQTLRRARLRLGVSEETCFCVASESEPIAVVSGLTGELAVIEAQRIAAKVDSEVVCRQRYAGRVAGVSASKLLDALHFLSAGAVSFARGLNDTPKIAALLVTGAALSSFVSDAAVGLVIAIGGWMMARRVAETMSHRITPMNAGQGLAANFVTALVVIGASRLGVPVSTTHVSCGGIFGVGAVTAEARWKTIAKIMGSWVITLPMSAAIAAMAYLLFR